MASTFPASRLRRLAAGPAQHARRHGGSEPRPGEPAPPGGVETSQPCELCSEPTPAGHRHLLDLSARTLCCVCRACSILFDRPAAGGGRYRLIPDRRWRLADFALDGAAWESLQIPVQTAFFFHDTAAGRVVAFYPSPAGAVESLLELSAWQRIEADNPVLRRLEPDVEALLVHRAGEVRDHFLTPIDDCYSLVGLIRAGWQGLSGGPRVWEAIAEFFGDLRTRAAPVRSCATESDG